MISGPAKPVYNPAEFDLIPWSILVWSTLSWRTGSKLDLFVFLVLSFFCISMCCLLLNTECCIQNKFCLFIHVIFKILNHFKFVLLKLCLKDLLLCGLDVTSFRFAYEEMGDGGGEKNGRILCTEGHAFKDTEIPDMPWCGHIVKVVCLLFPNSVLKRWVGKYWYGIFFFKVLQKWNKGICKQLDFKI